MPIRWELPPAATSAVQKGRWASRIRLNQAMLTSHPPRFFPGKGIFPSYYTCRRAGIQALSRFRRRGYYRIHRRGGAFCRESSAAGKPSLRRDGSGGFSPAPRLPGRASGGQADDAIPPVPGASNFPKTRKSSKTAKGTAGRPPSNGSEPSGDAFRKTFRRPSNLPFRPSYPPPCSPPLFGTDPCNTRKKFFPPPSSPSPQKT